MSEHDEVYGREREERLRALLRQLAERIGELDLDRGLVDAVPELLQRLGELRSELFHYEVRATYDTPEIAESRRIVEEAGGPPDFTDYEPEDDEPWRPE
jgi:PAS domain-containing protein